MQQTMTHLIHMLHDGNKKYEKVTVFSIKEGKREEVWNKNTGVSTYCEGLLEKKTSVLEHCLL